MLMTCDLFGRIPPKEIHKQQINQSPIIYWNSLYKTMKTTAVTYYKGNKTLLTNAQQNINWLEQKDI